MRTLERAMTLSRGGDGDLYKEWPRGAVGKAALGCVCGLLVAPLVMQLATLRFNLFPWRLN